MILQANIFYLTGALFSFPNPFERSFMIHCQVSAFLLYSFFTKLGHNKVKSKFFPSFSELIGNNKSKLD